MAFKKIIVMKIHKEGFSTLIIAFVVLVIIQFFAMPVLPPAGDIILLFVSIAFYIFLISFFRSPDRKVNNPNDNLLLSPCDGKVVVIEQVFEEEYIKAECWQISVFMSPLNVHINWFPSGGRILYSKYHPGKYLVAWHPKASFENERTTVCYQSGDDKILLRQIAGALARRIVCYATEDNPCRQGQEMGFIKFGSRVDIFLPLTCDIKVKLNDVVQGNRTVLATRK